MIPAFQPANVATAQAWLGERLAARQAFVVKGHGSRLVWNHEHILATAGLTETRFFDPEDMVVGVEAGLPFAALQRLLQSKGMYLPLNPWFSGATVGGMLAANDYGPDRMAGGGIRDFVIGIEYLNGWGKCVKAGGKVVKNVTGFDLGKLMIGSLGGLGIITAVNFKTRPTPPEPHGLFFQMSGNHWLTWFREDIYNAKIPIEWAQAVFSEGVWRLGLGIAGNADRRRRLVADLQAAFDGQFLVAAAGEEPAGFGSFAANHRYGGFLAPIVDELARPYFHVHGIFPTHAFLARERILEKLVGQGFVLVVHPVGADIHILGREEELDEEKLDRMRRLFSGNGGYLVLEKVPHALREQFGFTVPLPSGYLLMQRLKQQLDPHGIFHAPFYEMV